MTLEGEYYLIRIVEGTPSLQSRNPHDIGRRILQFSVNSPLQLNAVAILMTLEGEYYVQPNKRTALLKSCRNPHDIGRRILQKKLFAPCGHNRVAILMTLEGEYYQLVLLVLGEGLGSQSSWHWKANITQFIFYKSFPYFLSQSSWHWKANITQPQETSLMWWPCRNPHDIGRRILLNSVLDICSVFLSQSSWHWKANITSG